MDWGREVPMPVEGWPETGGLWPHWDRNLARSPASPLTINLPVVQQVVGSKGYGRREAAIEPESTLAKPPKAWASSQVSELPYALQTSSQRPPSCWKASMPIAFSPRVRISPTFDDSKRLLATVLSRSGDIPRPMSSTAMTG